LTQDKGSNRRGKGGWGELNEELHKSASNISTMIKSRIIIWAGYATPYEDIRNAHEILSPKT
jgi:hypothetical protein